MYTVTVATAGAVLKKIKILGFGGPGLKTHVLKEHSSPAPALEGEGRVIPTWLGWAYLAKKMQSPQPRPSQPPSNPVLDTEKWAPESAAGRS